MLYILELHNQPRGEARVSTFVEPRLLAEELTRIVLYAPERLPLTVSVDDQAPEEVIAC